MTSKEFIAGLSRRLGGRSYNAALVLAERGDDEFRRVIPDWSRECRVWWEASRWRGGGRAPEEYRGLSDALLRAHAWRGPAHEPAHYAAADTASEER